MLQSRVLGVRQSTKLIIALGVTSVVGSLAYAQSPAPPPATPVLAPTPAPASAPTPAPAPFGNPRSEEEANLAPQERVARSSAHLDRMRAVLKTVLKYLEEAREKRDVIKLNCVNEKLTAVKGLLKVSEQADVVMQEALARRDEETGRHEYDKISIARGKVDQLLSESEGCVGELSVYAGDTTVEMIGGDSSTTPVPPATNDVTRPTSGSPGEET